MSKDVNLSDEERRILAEIERYEAELRTGLPWTRLQAREGRRGDVWAWVAVVLGIAVLVTGLIANVAMIPFFGFVVLLVGVTRLTTRISLVRWQSRLRGDDRGARFGPRSGHDGT